MVHYIEKCTCGAVISQCKCIGDKSIRISSKPCTHWFIDGSVSSNEEISIDSLIRTHEIFLEKLSIPNIFRCHPSVYRDLRIYFDEQETEELLRLSEVKRPLPVELPSHEWSRLMGVDVVIDSDLELGEWRFERIVKTH